MENTILTFTVTDEYDNSVAKNFLRKKCNISARTLTRLKQTPMGITRNGILLKVIDNVYKGDVLKIKLPQDKNDIIPVKVPIDIIFEDEHIIVLNKPPHMPVHPTHDHLTDTLANGVAYYMKETGKQHAFRAINRLDRDTTGLVLVAKDCYSAYCLRNGVDKTYCAICQGEINKPGTINAPISLQPGHTIQRRAGSNGVSAITHYTPVKYKNSHTLLDIKLETGRTHQIRVHFSYIGHPLAGDDMYGGSLKYISRQALHCKELAFTHPVTNKKIELKAEIPNDMIKIMK